MKSSWAIPMALWLTVPILAAADVGLGPRYTDSLRGFSLQPPAGAQIQRETGQAQIVQFNLRDEQTGAVRIWMQVLQATVRQHDLTNLAEYARVLAVQLRQEHGFILDVDDPASVSLTTVAGRPAIDLRGPMGQMVRVSCRQVWVWLGEQSFLVLQTQGPLDDAQSVARISQASLDTLRLFDPEQARRQREQDLAHGARALDEVTLQGLRGQVAPQPYWLAIIQDNRVVGFVRYAESIAHRLDTEGLLVERHTVLVGENGARTLSREVLFCTANRLIESYDVHSTTTLPDGEVHNHREFALKQNDLLLVQTVVGPGRTRDTQHRLPEGIYMPQALSPLAPRLVDRGQMGSYGFAVYNPGGRSVDLRTVTVVNAESIRLGGREFAATLLTDQMAMDAPQSRVYVDQAGVPLLIESEDGTVLQQTTAEAVQARFRQEWQEVQRLPGAVGMRPGGPRKEKTNHD